MVILNEIYDELLKKMFGINTHDRTGDFIRVFCETLLVSKKKNQAWRSQVLKK